MIRGSGAVIIYTTNKNKMARIAIGEGLWSAIYANLNAMFTEIYAALASVGSGSGDVNKYQVTTNHPGGEARITTDVTTEPYSVMFLDNTGKIIGPHLIDVKMTVVMGQYCFDVYSTDPIPDLKLKITY